MNVFVTVGAQMPFSRLIKAVDEWSSNNPSASVFCQTNNSKSMSNNIEKVPFLESDEFKKRFNWADVIVAHAGMGSIITALQYGKPIVIFPRLGRLQETRNDHQVATTKRFATFDGVHAALNETELLIVLDALAELSVPLSVISSYASPELLNRISDFIKKS